MTVTDKLDDRTAWLEARRRGIGGSDVAAVLGLSPWRSPWALWAEKVGLIGAQDATEAMEFGLRAEPLLKGWFEDRTGLHVDGEQTVVIHPTESWMRCTLDGYVYDTPTGAWNADPAAALGLVEFKTTGDPAAEWETEIPVYYACQAGWSMAVTGMNHCWFGVLHLAFGRPQFRVYEFARDDDDIATMVAACRRFWDDHVVPGIEPPVDGSDATTTAIRDAYPDPDPAGTVDVTELEDRHLLFKLRRLTRLKADVRVLELSIAEAENAVKAALGGRTTLTNGTDLKGRPCVLATWRSQTRTDLDRDGLRAEAPELVAKYTTTKTIRVLRIRSDKESN